MRHTPRGTAAAVTGAALALGGSLLLDGTAQAAGAAPVRAAAPSTSQAAGRAAVPAGPNGCVKVRHIARNGVQARNVSCGRTVQVQVIWSTLPHSRYWPIRPGAKRDYYPSFVWQHYETIRIL
ncbi:hypothetical protein DZF91_16950 [Actinomadura logoneensis]|uniref:SH3 domain-containing protein n=1 Tax=Actinomadura logoneensis TaxID=2293572 RepID=A0A372JKB8_9ACTN|nr:hypothetical protein [Actinomadura logoneensis]RFU40467.1 hypothetical protein DZF91_16950 [Actinomadura logoneensis]